MGHPTTQDARGPDVVLVVCEQPLTRLLVTLYGLLVPDHGLGTVGVVAAPAETGQPRHYLGANTVPCDELAVDNPIQVHPPGGSNASSRAKPTTGLSKTHLPPRGADKHARTTVATTSAH